MQHDLIVIGSGPGGYIAAIRAAQLGLDVACIEREPALGGTCLRVGCIPSKALLESTHLLSQAQHGFAVHGIQTTGLSVDLPTLLGRKDTIVSTLAKGIEALFKKNKVTRYTGHGRIAAPGKVVVTGQTGTTELTAKHILIATGSKSGSLPGIELDRDRVGTSTEALSYSEVPGHLVVIGGGYIGLELGSVWHRLGAKVTVLEYLDRIMPGTDGEIAAEALKILKKQGLEFRLGTRVVRAKTQGSKCVVECEGVPPLECDRVLVAVGRIPNTDNLGLENVGIQLERGRIPVDSHFATGIEGIYAIGDVIRGPMLAHKAEDEAVACVEYIVTGYGHVNYDVIPAVAYTHPEVAGVGKTEEQLKGENVSYKKGVFPFKANARARTLDDTDGMVKILADTQTDRILGVHVIGPRAGDLIAEAAAAMEFGASSEDLARTCHAHPTLPEAMREAALSVLGKPLNM